MLKLCQFTASGNLHRSFLDGIPSVQAPHAKAVEAVEVKDLLSGECFTWQTQPQVYIDMEGSTLTLLS